MKRTMAGERLHFVTHAIRSILIISASSLLFACGSGTPEVEVSPTVQTNLYTNLPQPDQSSLDAAIDLAKRTIPLYQAGPCSDVATVAGGKYHTVGLRKDGTVVAIGSNGNNQRNVSSWSTIKAIAASSNQTVGLRKNGTVVADGSNTYGQLNVSSWTNIKAIAAGMYHTVGLKDDGTVVAVGLDGYGRLDVLSWTDIKAVAAGKYHTVGLKDDGTVVAVGYNNYGQMDVKSWTKITAIAAGENHTVGLREDGTVVAVGLDVNGSVKVSSSWANIKAVAAGASHTVGLKDDGKVVAVGSNTYGQLNVSSWTNMKAVAAGANHTVALKDDGTVEAVGNNDYKQLDVAALFTDIMPVCEAGGMAAPLDVSAPTTTATVTGTPGNNGWYLSNVEVTLAAADTDGGAGVMGIYYSVDGTAPLLVEGASASFPITGDGTHTVTWFGADNAGNAEAPREMTVNIDTTPPMIAALLTDPAFLWPPNHAMIDVLIGGIATDGGSGIASTVISVTDEYGILDGAVPGFGSTVALEAWRAGTDRDGRLYTITAVTTDSAGNQSSGTTTVIVPHDSR